MRNPIICVDFDGVIHSYSSGWKGISVIPDAPVPGAIEWLMDHLPVPEALGGCFAPEHTGPIVQIYSSRSKSWFGRRAMKNWLIKHGLPRCYISDGILQFPVKKPAAFLTIDDRAICFDGRFPSAAEMMAFKPWYKNPQPKAAYNDDEPAEIAYWKFDARRKGYSEWKGRPQSERDAFKAELRNAIELGRALATGIQEADK